MISHIVPHWSYFAQKPWTSERELLWTLANSEAESDRERLLFSQGHVLNQPTNNKEPNVEQNATQEVVDPQRGLRLLMNQGKIRVSESLKRSQCWKLLGTLLGQKNKIHVFHQLLIDSTDNQDWSITATERAPTNL